MEENTSIGFTINGNIRIKQPRPTQNNTSNIHGDYVAPNLTASPNYVEGDLTAFFDGQWCGVNPRHVIWSGVWDNLKSSLGDNFLKDSINATATVN